MLGHHTDPKWPVNECCVFKFFPTDVEWTENIWFIFRVKMPFLNFLRRALMWMGSSSRVKMYRYVENKYKHRGKQGTSLRCVHCFFSGSIAPICTWLERRKKFSLHKRLLRGQSHVSWGYLGMKTEHIEDSTLRSKLISEWLSVGRWNMTIRVNEKRSEYAKNRTRHYMPSPLTLTVGNIWMQWIPNWAVDNSHMIIITG